MVKVLILLCDLLLYVHAFNAASPKRGLLPKCFVPNACSKNSTPVEGASSNRRAILGVISTLTCNILQRQNAFAADQKPKEFTDMGTQAPASKGETEFVELSNGVKVKDFKLGTGTEIIKENSSVQVQASGRLLNLNGVIFYNTKNNNPDGFGAIPLSINLGKGQVIPGLESGIIGMRKGGIRRIIIPADLAYSKYPDLEPKPMNPNDQRALDSVIKNPRRDATILFDVSLERFNK